MRLRNFLMVGLALTLLFPFAASAVDWTAVGSTGAMDEGSLAVYATNDAALFFASGTTGNIISYFNVVNNSGTDTPPWTTLDLTSKDGSANGNVTAVLYRVPKCSGSAIAVRSALAVGRPPRPSRPAALASSISRTMPTSSRCSWTGPPHGIPDSVRPAAPLIVRFPSAPLPSGRGAVLCSDGFVQASGIISTCSHSSDGMEGTGM